MKQGTRIFCVDDEDMLACLNYVRDNGGQVACVDIQSRELLIVRGTRNHEKTELFNVDGVLGVVNVDASGPGESVEQA